ncbi:MAG: hypothetical protein NZ605_12895, partial [Acidimicrobiales bacterium]|nr:hypothetical protein [Acidimicrobiales bacterium]
GGGGLCIERSVRFICFDCRMGEMDVVVVDGDGGDDGGADGDEDYGEDAYLMIHWKFAQA